MSKQHSAIVKGLAILLMVIYHLPRILAPDSLQPAVAGFLGNISYPISFFVIVTGYGLYYAYHKGYLDWKYLLRRTARLYVSFWLVIAIFVFGIGIWLHPGQFDMTPYRIFTNLIGWRWDYCQFTWFLFTYILLTFCTKWIIKAIERLGNIASLILAYLLWGAMAFLISRFYDSFLRHHYYVYHIVLVGEMVSFITPGIIMARTVLTGKRLTWSKIEGKNVVVLLLLAAVFVIKGLALLPIFPYFAAVVVWLIAHLKVGAISRHTFIPLGNLSMMMWFCHGFLGPYLFLDYYLMIKSPLLAFIIWFTISLVVAWLLMPISNRISKALKLI